MNSAIIRTLLVSVTFCTIIAQPVLAADMGGQLKLKDDSIQELKEVMEYIKSTVNNEKFTDNSRSLIFIETQDFAYSKCKVKYRADNKTVVVKDGTTQAEDHEDDIFNLTDIESTEISNSKSHFADFIHVKLPSRDFNKSVQKRSRGYISTRDGDLPYDRSEMTDNISIRVATLDKAEDLIRAFNKAIKLCAEK